MVQIERVDPKDGWGVTNQEIRDVDPYEGNFAINFVDGGSIYVPNKNNYPLPSAGDTVTVHWENSAGWGGRFVGVKFGNYQYFYKTRQEVEQERIDWKREYEESKDKALRDNLDDWIARKNKLLPVLRDRINRFENKEGVEAFWREDGGYELFILEQAQLLYNWSLASEDPLAKIDEFDQMPYKEQAVAFEGFDDGHSGNTFGAMIAMARAMLQGKPL